MLKRSLLSILAVLAFAAPSMACLDCSGTLSNAALIGNTFISSLTVTGSPIISTNGFSGPGHLLTSLPGDSTEYIQNSSTLQTGATFYVASGTVQGNFIAGGNVTGSSATFASLTTTASVTISSMTAGFINVSSINVVGTLKASSITLSGNLATSGTLTASNFIGSASGLTDVPASAASTTNWVSNLFVSTQGTNTNQIYASADEMDIMGFRAVAVATVCDISKTGTGGRGPGSGDIANRMYSAWFITNGTTVSIHAEEGYKTVPTDMPVGYTKWRKITDFLNDGSSNITPFKQKGSRVTFMPAIELLSTVSPSATFVRLNSHIYLSSAATVGYFYVNAQEDIDQFKVDLGALEYQGTMTTESSFHILTNANNGVQLSMFNQSIPLFESRDIKYRFPNTGTSLEIRLNGYDNGGIK